MLHAITTARETEPRSERVSAIARWLAKQRAIPTSMAEQTAWQVHEEAGEGGLALEGPKAPLIVQPRFSLWLVGQLDGAPLLHVFADEARASEKAQALGAEMKVPVLLVDRGGDIVSRFDPPRPPTIVAPLAPPVPPPPVAVAPVEVARPVEGPAPVEGPPPPPPLLKVARLEGRWAVLCEGRVVATAPTREKARQRARVLKTDPDFCQDPTRVPSE